MNGAKKGDKIDRPDDDEEDIIIEKDREDIMNMLQIPVMIRILKAKLKVTKILR